MFCILINNQALKYRLVFVKYFLICLFSCLNKTKISKTLSKVTSLYSLLLKNKLKFKTNPCCVFHGFSIGHLVSALLFQDILH